MPAACKTQNAGISERRNFGLPTAVLAGNIGGGKVAEAMKELMQNVGFMLLGVLLLCYGCACLGQGGSGQLGGCILVAGNAGV